MSLKGKIIVIEGTDGSGKQTQAAKLRERLEQEGYKVYSTSFPRYDSDSSAAVRMYLNGHIKKQAQDVSAKAASTFYAVDRYITYKREIEPLYLTGESVIVFDRWVESNIIHQGAKLISQIADANERQEKLGQFVKWLHGLEYSDFAVPKPDVTIYLNVPIDYTIKLREGRLNKSNGAEKQDIHEADTTHLVNASESGLLAAKMFSWQVIECVQNGKMRTVEDIAEEVWQRINESVNPGIVSR